MTLKDKIRTIAVGKQLIGWVEHSKLEGLMPTEIVAQIKYGLGQEDLHSSYDNYDNYDVFYLGTPVELKDENSMEHLSAFITKNEVLISYTHWSSTEEDFIPGIIRTAVTKKDSAQRAVITLIDFLTKDDEARLSRFENTISTLEETIMDASDDTLKGKNKIVSELRHQVHAMQRMYGQLLDAIEDLIEDENELYSDTVIKYATRIHNRIERRYKSVLSLRDYITSVREAYQTQIDIGLNSIMKIFTVITTIFLPLTLLVGWYGMNLMIPEFEWKYGYPAVIAASIIIIVGCLIFFKKKRWF